MFTQDFLNTFWKELFARQAQRLLPHNDYWVEGTISRVCNTGSDWHVIITVTEVGPDVSGHMDSMHLWWGGLNLPEPVEHKPVRVYLGTPLKEFPSGLFYEGRLLNYRSHKDRTTTQWRRYKRNRTSGTPPKTTQERLA